MTPDNATTLCLTAGGRPDLLARTLSSLLATNRQFFDTIIITNDAGDNQTTETAKALCPDAIVLHHTTRAGQLASIDEMYGRVRTPYIFHCEDDWVFDPVPFVPTALSALQSLSNVSVVSVRQSGCLWNTAKSSPEASGPQQVEGGWAIQIKPSLWSSYSFNPSVVRRDLWQALGPFSKYDNEIGLDRSAANRGLTMAYLVPGVCYHIGEGRHFVDPFQERASPYRKAWRSLRRKVTAFVQTK